MAEPDAPLILLLDTDLFFVVKVRTTLQHAGYDAGTARSVADFTRRLAADSASDRITITGLMVGTPAYVAPELWLGAEADERSDIYAFGVTLHVMLTGVTPFDGWSMAQLRNAHLSAQPPELRLTRDDPLSADLETILLRCLAWSADERVQTVHELHDALLALHDPNAWTAADAEAFWKSAEKARFG